MSVSGAVLIVASVILEGIAYLAAAWAAYLVCARLGRADRGLLGVGRTSIDASLIKVAGRVAGIAAAITIIFVGATNVGLPLYGVIAGLGVGGLALGLAARPTLENLIGGFTLYADRPVRVGEVCKFGDEFGIVEEIGLRSTRLRALDRTLITVPNADFSNMVLVNFTRRDQIAARYDDRPPLRNHRGAAPQRSSTRSGRCSKPIPRSTRDASGCASRRSALLRARHRHPRLYPDDRT